MSKQHGIAWLNIPGYKGESWNVVSGCTPVSIGCQQCYAREMISRFAGMKGWPASPDVVTMFPERIQQPYRWKKPRAIFVPSMGDMFHKEVPWNFQYKVFEMMMHCPQHIFIILTKRAEIMRKNIFNIYTHLWRNYPEKIQDNTPLPNVWVGISAEDQESFDTRIPHLVQTMSAKKIVSVEPMLTEVSMVDYYKEEGIGTYSVWNDYIDWVICGAETGKKFRPMDIAWARKLKIECSIYDVPFFMKQITGKGKIPDDLMVREFPI